MTAGLQIGKSGLQR